MPPLVTQARHTTLSSRSCQSIRDPTCNASIDGTSAQHQRPAPSRTGTVGLRVVRRWPGGPLSSQPSLQERPGPNRATRASARATTIDGIDPLAPCSLASTTERAFEGVAIDATAGKDPHDRIRWGTVDADAGGSSGIRNGAEGDGVAGGTGVPNPTVTPEGCPLGGRRSTVVMSEPVLLP
jgi:hypothetical protein